MGNWGSDVFVNSGPKSPLEHAVWNFPPNLKQAMYAAASRKTIKRGDWNGCAFNEAGTEVNKWVRSTHQASDTFGVPYGMVNHFIQVWDQEVGTDVECTIRLRDALKRADLWREAGVKPPRIFNVKVYESQQSALHRQFDELMKFNAIPDEDIALDILVGANQA